MKEIKETMRETLRQEGLDELEELLRIKNEWYNILGKETGERTSPYRLEKGKLYVGVESHAWAQELHFSVEEIKTQLKRVLGIEITDVVIKKVNF
jgi:predicted nucleic acid-binding Zn ribbon protein